MPSVLFDTIERKGNFTETENHALTYKSSLNKVLDFFFRGGAARGWSESRLVELFQAGFAEDRLLAMKVLFYLRDVRGGQGERRTFRRVMQYLGTYYPELVRANIDNISHYGRWDDLINLINCPKLEKDVCMLIGHQLKQDLKHYSNSEPVSLLAKWLPSINTSSRDTKKLAKKICAELKYSYRDYRKTVATLRSSLHVVEKKMCANNWEFIEYSKVPSKAMLQYSKAFDRHDTERFTTFIKDVAIGASKINAGALYPYEITKRCSYSDRWTKEDTDVLNVLWDSLPDYLEGNPHRGIAVVDVSGSMTISLNNPNIRPIDIATSLGIYIAERNPCEVFGNKFITFSEVPTLQRIKGDDIMSKVSCLMRSDWGFSTNIQSVFSLILTTAVEKNLTAEELPEVLYIISDMEFDEAQTTDSLVDGDHVDGLCNFEAIREQYKETGYTMPKIVFWNVDSKTEQVPVTIDDNGVCMVSGFSPTILQSLLAGEIQDPVQVMIDTVTTDRYDQVVV